MSVSEHLRRTVALITAPGEISGAPSRPIASGFFVSVIETHPSPPYLTRREEYIVTSAHLIRGVERSSVRVSRGTAGDMVDGGRVEEIAIRRWYCSEDPEKDIAAAPLDFSVGDYDHATIHFDPFAAYSSGKRVDSEAFKAHPGEPVHVITLHTGAGIAHRGLSLIRSGTLAATWEQGVPIVAGANRVQSVTGHLIDVHPRAAISGSPCFLSGEANGGDMPFLVQEARKLGDESVWRRALERHQETKFFGMVAGHLPSADGASTGDGGLGIAVVVPREHVAEVIYSQAFAEERTERMRRQVEATEKRDAVPDHGPVRWR